MFLFEIVKTAFGPCPRGSACGTPFQGGDHLSVLCRSGCLHLTTMGYMVTGRHLPRFDIATTSK